tara:strand:- start:684 stop:890 length:207 start_codon:yes stop_codon:yes gene_type:complete
MLEVRSIQKFFTHRSVSTFDRVPFRLTGGLFLYGTALRVSVVESHHQKTGAHSRDDARARFGDLAADV